MRPGGIFYIHEGHPVMWAIDDEQTAPNELRLGFDYWGGETSRSPWRAPTPTRPPTSTPRSSTAGTTRSARSSPRSPTTGCVIELLDEKRVLDWPAPFLSDRGDGTYVWPEGTRGSLPLMYSLRARKP